jgi:hypothetical protein
MKALQDLYGLRYWQAKRHFSDFAASSSSGFRPLSPADLSPRRITGSWYTRTGMQGRRTVPVGRSRRPCGTAAPLRGEQSFEEGPVPAQAAP